MELPLPADGGRVLTRHSQGKYVRVDRVSLRAGVVDLVLRGGIVDCFFFIGVKGNSLVKGMLSKTIVKENKTD